MVDENTAEEMAELEGEADRKRIKGLLAKTVQKRELTDKEREKADFYTRIFTDYCAGINVMELAEKYDVSRPTVYTALEYFKKSNLIKDRDINMAMALHRIRLRLRELEAEVVAEKAKTVNQSTKYLGMLYGEIRKNEEMMNNMMGILHRHGEEDKKAGGNIIILNNIRGGDPIGGEKAVYGTTHRSEGLHSPADAESFP